VSFADILFIILISLLIYGLLQITGRKKDK